MKNRVSDISELEAVTESKAKEIYGLKLYPLTMRRYDIWESAGSALLLRLSTLPASLAVLPYISAVFALDRQSAADGAPLGLLNKLFTLLCLAMRLPLERMEDFFRFAVDSGDHSVLRSVAIYGTEETELNVDCIEPDCLLLPFPALPPESGAAALCVIGGESYEVDEKTNIVKGFPAQLGWSYLVSFRRISEKPAAILKPQQFDELREIIARQNGAELPDEAENPELIQAQELLSEKGTLDQNITDLMDSVAYASGLRFNQLLDWTICEFKHRLNTIQRDKQFLVCAIGSITGKATWKNGNPYPSWCFDRADADSMHFVSEKEMLSRMEQVSDIK
ncbi:MAG: hypothetical protein RR235_04960 [Oscillospiraceae bacterium]